MTGLFRPAGCGERLPALHLFCLAHFATFRIAELAPRSSGSLALVLHIPGGGSAQVNMTNSAASTALLARAAGAPEHP